MPWDIDYSRYYQKYHNDSTAHREWMVEFYHRMLEAHLPPKRLGAALDIGCGRGYAMLYLQQAGFKPIEGIEIDVQQAASCKDKGLTVYQVTDSAAFVREQGEKYSLILALDVLEHMAPTEQITVVRAVYSALRPGGRFICSVPNANSTVAARQRYNDFTHHVSYGEHSLDFLLFNGGFKDISIHGYEMYEPPHQKPVGPGDFARRRHFLTYISREYIRWLLRGVTRSWRRLEMIAEFGFQTGGEIPLTLNLLGIATKETL